MLRLLSLICVTCLIAANASAQNCYLTSDKDQQGHLTARVVKGFSPDNVLCRCPTGIRKHQVSGTSLGAIIDPVVVTLGDTGEVVSEKPWVEGTELGDRQRIECRKDQAAIDQAKADRASEQAEERARKQKRMKLRADFVRECIEKFSETRGRGKDFNACLSALFKKVFADDQFEELPEDALEFGGGP